MDLVFNCHKSWIIIDMRIHVQAPSTPTTPSRLAVADLLAECEKRQISTKAQLQRWFFGSFVVVI